jgi:hypothetical protein
MGLTMEGGAYLGAIPSCHGELRVLIAADEHATSIHGDGICQCEVEMALTGDCATRESLCMPSSMVLTNATLTETLMNGFDKQGMVFKKGYKAAVTYMLNILPPTKLVLNSADKFTDATYDLCNDTIVRLMEKYEGCAKKISAFRACTLFKKRYGLASVGGSMQLLLNDDPFGDLRLEFFKP